MADIVNIRSIGGQFFNLFIKLLIERGVLMFLYYYDFILEVVFRIDETKDIYESYNRMSKSWMPDSIAREVAAETYENPVFPVTYGQALLLCDGQKLSDALMVS